MEQSHLIYAQELHWRLAAKWNNLTFDQFLAYEGEEQSRMLATYEASNMIDAVMSSDAARRAKRQNVKKRR